MNIWKFLSKSFLQEYIDEDVLARLEYLLPVFDSNIDDYSLHSKSTLVSIFDAFVAASALPKKEFRYKFLNSLPPEIIDTLCIELQIDKTKLFDQKIELICKIPWSNSHKIRTFLKVLDLPQSLAPIEKKLPDQQKIILFENRRYMSLKDYQTSVYFDAITQLSNPRSRFIVQMPTGSGKTRTAMEIICSVLNDNKPQSIVLWLAHSEELCEQAYACFEDVWHHVKNKDLKLVRVWGAGGALPQEVNESCIIIGGFQKLHSMLTKNPSLVKEISKKVKLIVVDEAHKVIAPTYKEVTNAFIGDDTHVIGLTATPGRSVVDESQNKKLANYFFKQILTIKTDERPVLQYLRDRKILSHTQYFPIKTNRNYELSKREMEHIERFFDLPPGILRRIGNDDARNIEIIRRMQQECSEKKQILFFACSVDHSRFITAMLTLLGINAAHVDGSVPKGKRGQIIQGFRSNEIQVLCNYGVLSTGFDAPKTDVVFISRPTSSVVLYSQMIGRGLRGPAIGGTAECKVIDLIDNIKGFGNEDFVYEYFDEYYSSQEKV